MLQFFLIVAGFLPLVWLGLRNVGGWAGLKASLPVAYMHSVAGHDALPAPIRMGIEIFGLGMGLGFRARRRVLVHRLSCHPDRHGLAQHRKSARRVPLIAAVPKMFFPFLVILPGLMAIAVPTPHIVTMVTRNADAPSSTTQPSSRR